MADGASQSKKMVLNFQGVQFMSSAMIGKLVLLNKKCKASEVALKLCQISPNVLEVFKITRLNQQLDRVSRERDELKEQVLRKNNSLEQYKKVT